MRGIVLSFVLVLLFSCRSKESATGENGSENARIRNKYAGLMGVNPDDIKNVKLYKFIDDWYGAPYKYGGKAKTGVDCSGFVSQLMANVYGKTVSGSSASIHKASEKVNKKNLQEGDLVFFKISSDQVSHIGVYLQNNRFVHASTKRGVVINSLQEEYYTKYYFAGGRIP